MARRRRKKGNPLLVRILVISVAAHAIILPVAAHFGAFEKFKKQFGDSRVVMVSLPPSDVEKPKEAPKAEKKTKTAEKKAGASAPKAAAASKPGLPQPKVVASSGPADGGGSGPSVDANAAGKAGVLPGGESGGGTPSTKPPENPPVIPPETKPVETTKPKLPDPPVVTPKPPDPLPVTPKTKRVVQAEAIETPEPTIPDELRTEPFEKTLVVEADVDTGGHPINVKVAESTGVKQLDSAGLDTAKRYRFKPATVDDEPVTQHVRFRIIFKVE